MRPANQIELGYFIRLVCARDGIDEENLSTFWAMVVDDYITDCPGYAGPVGIVLWGGSPTWITVFTHNPHGRWQVEFDTCRIFETTIPTVREKLQNAIELLNRATE